MPSFTNPYAQSANYTGRVLQDSWKAVVRALKDAPGRYGVNGDELRELHVQDPC